MIARIIIAKLGVRFQMFQIATNNNTTLTQTILSRLCYDMEEHLATTSLAKRNGED